MNGLNDNERHVLLEIFTKLLETNATNQTSNYNYNQDILSFLLNEIPSHTINDINNDNIRQLLSFSRRQQELLNACNLPALETLYEQYCTDDVILQLPRHSTLPDIIGNKNVLNFIYSYVITLPDLLLRYVRIFTCILYDTFCMHVVICINKYIIDVIFVFI